MHHVAVYRHVVARPQPLQSAERLAVLDLDATALHLARLAGDADWSSQIAVLPHGRLGPPVRPGQPVQAEVAVIRLLAEVATIRPSTAAVRSFLDQSMIAKFPDEPTLQPVRALDGIPVLRQRAVAVAHRVRVLAHDQRVLLLTGLRVGDDRSNRRIHRADDVAGALLAG